MTALMITTNLVVLQSLSRVQPAYAQSAHDLEPVEAVSLHEGENTKLEILGVGGGQELTNATASAPAEIEKDSLENETSEIEGIHIFPDMRTNPSSCNVSGFPIITLCIKF